jgi:protein-disulfide isomerase
MKKPILISILLSLLLALIFLTRCFWNNRPASEETKITKAVIDTPLTEFTVPANAPHIGPENAKVTVVSFLDYDFPPSVLAARDLQTVIERYRDRVNFVFIHYLRDSKPCTKTSNSCKSARAAVCAQEHESFFETHSALISVDPSKKNAVNTSPFKECMNRTSTFEKIASDRNFGKKLEIQTPPSFLVAGRRIEGSIPVSVWNQILDEVLLPNRR